MGTLPWRNYNRYLQVWQPGFHAPGSMLALKNNVIIMSRTIKDPLKTIDFKGFQGFFNVQGQPRLSSKGNLAYPLPISPKNKTEAKYTGKLSL